MNTHSLLTYYKGWGIYQRMLVDVIAPLSPQQLAMPVTSARWTIGRTVQHLVANRVWWFQLWMGAGSAELGPIAQWDPAAAGETAQPPTIPHDELLAGLQSTWSMVEQALAHWVPADLEQVVHPPAVLSAEEQQAFGATTLQWIIWHVFEHEIHHGGQISYVLGQHGVPGIYGGM